MYPYYHALTWSLCSSISAFASCVIRQYSVVYVSTSPHILIVGLSQRDRGVGIIKRDARKIHAFGTIQEMWAVARSLALGASLVQEGNEWLDQNACGGIWLRPPTSALGQTCDKSQAASEWWFILSVSMVDSLGTFFESRSPVRFDLDSLHIKWVGQTIAPFAISAALLF